MAENTSVNTNAEYITIILGAIGIFLLINSVSGLSKPTGGGFGDLASILFVFMQLIFVLVALPFLMKGFNREVVMKWFVYIILAMSAINAILVVILIFLLPDQNPTSVSVFVVIAIIELTPLFLYLGKRSSLVYD